VNFQDRVNDLFSDFIFSHYPPPKEATCVLGFASRALRLCAFARNEEIWLMWKFTGGFSQRRKGNPKTRVVSFGGG